MRDKLKSNCCKDIYNFQASVESGYTQRFEFGGDLKYEKKLYFIHYSIMFVYDWM